MFILYLFIICSLQILKISSFQFFDFFLFFSHFWENFPRNPKASTVLHASKFANYFTDISPIQKYYDDPFNIIVGPGITQQAHQTNEYVKKSEIIKSRKIYEYLINEIC